MAHFFLKRASSFALDDAMRDVLSSGAPSLNVKKVQKFAFSRSGMYSAMCSLHWLCAEMSQCSQFLQHWRSTPQCGHVSARWSFTSNVSSFRHLWQKWCFSSTFGTQLIAGPPYHGAAPGSGQTFAPLDVADDPLVLDLPR